jgi:hypothetical protein
VMDRWEEEADLIYYRRIRAGDFRTERERYEVEKLLPWAEAEARHRVEITHSSQRIRFPDFEDQLAGMWTQDIFWEAKKQAERAEREERDQKRREEQERQEAEKAETARLRKIRGKPLNRVIFDVRAMISPDAEGTFEAFKKRYHPPKRMYPKRVRIDGQNLWMWVEYTVKGGHQSDIRRALSKCVADAGAEMVGEPIIDVIEREKLPDTQTVVRLQDQNGQHAGQPTDQSTPEMRRPGPPVR